MNDISAIAAPSGLTQEEAQFVYGCEVLGLPARKAATMAEMPLSKISAPHLIQARELLKREMRGVLQITKEDIIFRMMDAVDRAGILAEPATEIIGLKEVAKLMGYDTPQKIDINISSSIEVLRANVRNMDDRKLAEMLGAGDIIDGDFYEVR